MENTELPDIYIMSKFESLPSELKKCLPKNVNIIPIPMPRLRLNYDKDIVIPDQAKELARKAEIIIVDCNCLSQMLYELPNAKWVQSTWAGIEPVIYAINPSKPLPNFVLTRFTDLYFGEMMSNYVLAQIINIERELYDLHCSRREYKWDRPKVLPDYRVLSEIVVGTLGAGSLGSTVGKLLMKTGCKVIAFVRSGRDKESEAYNEVTTSLNYVLENCDYICNILPSTRETIGLLDGEILRVCRKKPVFINIGRGDIIKEDSIIKALKEGWISKAVLDVFDTEPLPSESPLWKIPEVYITPHIAGLMKINGVASFVATNYLKYIKGEPLLNVVSWEKGY